MCFARRYGVMTLSPRLKPEAYFAPVSNNKIWLLVWTTEHYLAHNFKEKLKSTVLISPHHGSKTSSSQVFLKAVSPTLVVISSGFKNRFHHPNKTIMQRYKTNNIKVLQTQCSGQIGILFNHTINITEYRKDSARY
jgi:competence protein ComEC